MVDGPDWHYGPWNGSGHMCVDITVWDDNGDAVSNWNFKEVCGRPSRVAAAVENRHGTSA